MKKFEVGKKYFMFSPCNQNCIWSYTITGRTEKTVTLVDDKGKTKKCRINDTTSNHLNAESVFPLWRYSMCPILSADN